MNLKRQLLLVSVLTLVLPWAGYKFVHETELALRAGQQQMLASTARAVADSIAQYREEFPRVALAANAPADQLYGHRLETRPEIDGYFDDWTLERTSLRSLPGTDGPIRFAVGMIDEALYLYVEVADDSVVFERVDNVSARPHFADRVDLINISPPYLDEAVIFAAEAPGPVVATIRGEYGLQRDRTILAHWQDVPGGYQVEARIPASKLGTHLGVVVSNTAGELARPIRSASFSAATASNACTSSIGTTRSTSVSSRLSRNAAGTSPDAASPTASAIFG